MKVRALKVGYYNNSRQHPGATFHIQSDKHFSEKWMEKCDKNEKPKKVVSKPARSEAKADLDSEVI